MSIYLWGFRRSEMDGTIEIALLQFSKRPETVIDHAYFFGKTDVTRFVAYESGHISVGNNILM